MQLFFTQEAKVKVKSQSLKSQQLTCMLRRTVEITRSTTETASLGFDSLLNYSINLLQQTSLMYPVLPNAPNTYQTHKSQKFKTHPSLNDEILVPFHLTASLTLLWLVFFDKGFKRWKCSKNKEST